MNAREIGQLGAVAVSGLTGVSQMVYQALLRQREPTSHSKLIKIVPIHPQGVNAALIDLSSQGLAVFVDGKWLGCEQGNGRKS